MTKEGYIAINTYKVPGSGPNSLLTNSPGGWVTCGSNILARQDRCWKEVLLFSWQDVKEFTLTTAPLFLYVLSTPITSLQLVKMLTEMKHF